MTRRNISLLIAALVAAALAGTVALRHAQQPDAGTAALDSTATASASPSTQADAATVPGGSSAPAAAALPSPGGAWAKLTPRQQEALAPLAQNWNAMSDRQREKWVEIAGRFHKLSPEARKRLHDRMADWVRLTPEQRQLARESYQNAKNLPPDRKVQVWEQYQKLTDEQKKKLAADDKKLSNRPNVVSAPPSGRTGVKNPYAAVHRKQNPAEAAKNDMPSPVLAPAASAPGASMPAPAPTAVGSATTPNAGAIDDSVINSDIYHHN